MGRKFGAPLPFWGRGLCPHLSPSPGLRPTSITSGILMYPSSRLATIEMDRKMERGLRLLFGDGAGSSSSKIAWAEAYLHVKYHLDPSSRLATINKGGKFVGSVLFWGEGAGSPSNKVAWAKDYLHTKCYLDPCSHAFGRNRCGPKMGGCAPLERESWVLI